MTMPKWFTDKMVQCPACKSWVWKYGEEKCICNTPVVELRARAEKPGEPTRPVNTVDNYR